MVLYHYSVTYKGDPQLTNDYNKRRLTAEPMISALRKGVDWFEVLLLGEQYHARLMAEKGKFYNYVKDAAEALFEFIREREFPDSSVSRLGCVYYFPDLSSAVKAAYEDWIDCGDLTKDEVKILEVQVSDGGIYEYDQEFYNRAYELMKEHRIAEAAECARKYFSGEKTDSPIPEILSGGENTVIREIEY